MKTRTLLLAIAALLACDPPPVHKTADRRQGSQTTHIEGEVVATGTMRGNAILFLFDATRPPPPQGTGRPIAFTFVPAAELFGDKLGVPSDVGPFIAPFVLSQVPAGPVDESGVPTARSYIIKGFIDAVAAPGADPSTAGRKSDFNPWYGVTSEVNKGDVGGGYVDPVSRSFRTLTVAPDADGLLQPVTGISVSFAQSALTSVPVDRPAFKVSAVSPNITGNTWSPGTGNAQLTIDVEPVMAGPVDQRGPAFLLKYVDDNGDNVPDTVLGNRQVWPKVIVRKLSDDPTNTALLIDENDVDKNGILDAAPRDFVDYEHLNPLNGQAIPKDGKADLVVLAAGWHPVDVAAALNESGSPTGNPLVGPTGLITVPRTTMRLVLGSAAGPAALDATNPTAPQFLSSIPPGKYAIVLIQQTGQTWRTPNELNPLVAQALSLPDTYATQAFFLNVTAP